MTSVEKIVTGFKWTAGGRLAAQFFNWMITIVVIRFLEPHDYGVFAVALVITTFMSLLSESGVGNGLIRNKGFGDTLLRKAFAYILIINLFMFALLYLSAPYVAGFYEKEQLTDILQVQAYKFIIISLSVIPDAKLRYKMRFKRLSINSMVSGFAGGCLTLLLAINGFGVWSLVLGNLARLFLLTVLSYLAEPTFLLPDFRIRDLEGVGSFGILILLNRLVFFFYTKADILLISKIFDTVSVGYYSVAKDLATLPMAKIAASINIVGFSAFNTYEKKTETLGRHYLKTTASLAFIAFPVFIGISSIAPELLPVVLGENWTESIVVLQIIALSVPFRILNIINTALHEGAGSVRVNLGNAILAAVVFVPAFALSTKWGVAGVSTVWAVLMPVYFAWSVRTLKPYSGVTIIEVIKQLIWPIIASVVMFITVRGIHSILADYQIRDIWALPIEIISGVITYLIVTVLYNREQLVGFIKLARNR